MACNSYGDRFVLDLLTLLEMWSDEIAADGDESRLVVVVSIWTGRDILLFIFVRIGMRLGVADMVMVVLVVIVDAIFRPLLWVGRLFAHNEDIYNIQINRVGVVTDNILCASEFNVQQSGGGKCKWLNNDCSCIEM